MQVIAGEKVRVGRNDDEYPGRWCRASNGREGWIPVELPSEEGREATVLDEYSAQELAADEGEDVEIEDERHALCCAASICNPETAIPVNLLVVLLERGAL